MKEEKNEIKVETNDYEITIIPKGKIIKSRTTKRHKSKKYDYDQYFFLTYIRKWVIDLLKKEKDVKLGLAVIKKKSKNVDVNVDVDDEGKIIVTIRENEEKRKNNFGL